MQAVQQGVIEFWRLTEEMAPYLLLGFLFAGLLRILVSEAWIKRHLGARGWKQTVKASLLGVPLPLCSCGVIPVAASLHRQGGSNGATAAFAASTPQTGVDSILATAGLLNGPFALLRVVVAFISGITAGTLIDAWDGRDSKRQRPRVDPLPRGAATTHACCASTPAEAPAEPAHACCGGGGGDTGATASTTSPSSAKIREGLHFGLVDLPADIGKSLLIGLALAALIATFLPSDLSQSSWTHGLLGYLAITLVAIPLYVCSTGSIPMAYALLTAGFSPGAALVFLIAGPATNTATVSALWKMLGGRSVMLYLGSLIAIAWATGALLDASSLALEFAEVAPMHDHRTWWKTASAVALLALLAYAFRPTRKDDSPEPIVFS